MMNEVALGVLRQLNAAGHSAYFVGGCVRDHLLGVPFVDIDIASAATPDQVMALFDSTIATGVDYGTVTVCVEGQSFEVTTFRKDFDYRDGRRPTVIQYSASIEDDLARRDFTINAMALSATGDLIDPLAGRIDLAQGIIRAVGSPAQRFAEDKLRKLRAVRFASQKQFDIEATTWRALCDHPELTGVSVERILVEVNKVLLSELPSRGLKLLAETTMLAQIHPKLAEMIGFEQLNPYHLYDLWHHTLRAVDGTAARLALRWAALLHDIGKLDSQTIDDEGIAHYYGHQHLSSEWSRRILKHLRASRELMDDVAYLIDMHMYVPVLADKPLRRWANKVGADALDDIQSLLLADQLATGTLDSRYSEALASQLRELFKRPVLFSRANLALDGHDLLQHFAILRGDKRLFKPLFDALVAACVDCPELNNRTDLLRLAGSWLDDF